MTGQVTRARAPLRLGLAGGGTDVAPYYDVHGGAILNATISWYAYATISPAPPGKVVFRAVDLGIEVVLDADSDLPVEEPLMLHRGIWRRIVRDYNGGRPLSLTLTTASDVSAGSGLGSSSTLTVAVIEAFKEHLGLPLGEYDVARLAVDVERRELGFKGGLQDQYAATFGGVNFMEFGAGGRVIVNPLRINRSSLAELEASLVLYFTGVSRESAAIIEDQSNLLEKKEAASLEAMHDMKRDAHAMKERLLLGDIRGLARVLEHSWEAKKRTSARVSSALLERTHDLAIENGAYAGKVSGAGGGGFMFFLVDPARRANVVRALSAESGTVMTCHFTQTGASAWRVRDGVEV
jgi:D-glycero-alpha-D-manno-heptose-7-phosphate kinase